MIENKLGQNFDSLEKRILYTYVAAYPEFVPADCSTASIESQKQMHEFTYKCLGMIYDDPGIIGLLKQSDSFYENYELNNSKPELIKAMTNIEKKHFKFWDYIVKLGLLGKIKDDKLLISKNDLKLTKPAIERLKKFGIIAVAGKDGTVISVPEFPLLMPAWKTYSAHAEQIVPAWAQKVPVKGLLTQRVIAFIHGRCEGRKYRAENLFSGLCSGNEIRSLETYFENEGFTCITDNSAYYATRIPYIEWYKEYPGKEKSYMRVFFDGRKRQQLYFEFKVPEFRSMLNAYNEMEKEFQELIFKRLKTCDGCGYCTQTDKSGKRPRIALKLTLGETTANKCPLFPYLFWYRIDGKTRGEITGLFDLAISALQ